MYSAVAQHRHVAGIVLPSDPRIATVCLRECGEPLVDMRTVAPLRLDARRADPTGAYAHIRAGIVDRLVAAQSLLDRGLRLLVIEGYRPPELQERYFQRYRERLHAAHPQWSPEDLDEQVYRRFAPPDLAPHVTGAAVDLTLTDEGGVELPMGTEVHADPDAAGDPDSPYLPPLVRTNRLILAAALGPVGFVNAVEWWHWSYGDRYWALVTGRRSARYGPLADRRVRPAADI
jgi:zinc D-Ala-D-Ala dipeptidase